jgi:hypothetical protein
MCFVSSFIVPITLSGLIFERRIDSQFSGFIGNAPVSAMSHTGTCVGSVASKWHWLGLLHDCGIAPVLGFFKLHG